MSALLILTIVGCSLNSGESTSRGLPNAPAWMLLLDRTSFPQSWDVDPCTKSPLCFGEQEAVRTFGIVNVPGHVLQEVERHTTVQRAKTVYEAARTALFNKAPPPRSPSTELLPPPEISYHSPIADDFHLGCGVNVVPACQAIFRYRNYFVHLYFDLDKWQQYGLERDGDGLQLQDVEPILRAMDAKASSVLGIALPTWTP